MNIDEQLKKLSEKERNELPPHLKLRLGFLLLQTEKKDEELGSHVELNNEPPEENTPLEMIKRGLRKQLDQELKDALDD